MFILDLPELVDLNTYIRAERRNRFLGAKIKKEMTELVAYECVAQKIPKMSQITDITFTWYHKNKRKDFDNVEFAQKWIRDGLVKAGVIKGDGWEYFPPRTTHLHAIKKEKPGVTVICR